MQGMANAMQQQQMYYQQQLQQQYFPQNTSRTSRQSKEPVVETTKIEDDGFVWIKLRQWNPSKEEHIYGAKDENGKVIIPLSRGYTFICYHKEEGFGGYFGVDKGKYEGVCDRYGKVLFAPVSKASYICIDGKFKKENSKGDWIETLAYLDSEGHGHKKSSGSSSNWGWDSGFNNMPYYPSTSGYSAGNESNTSNSTGNRPAETLNQTVGSKCLTCHGTGKCHACNGTKVASGLGNTYKCTVCDTNGNCPSCHGTGVASWNR